MTQRALIPGGIVMLRRLLDPIDWFVARVVIAAMASMAIILPAQVLLRYGLNLSLDWAEEISRLCFVWAVFLAIPLGIKRGAHVGISLLTDRLPAGVGSVLFRTLSALSLVLMAVVAKEAAVLTIDQWDEPMSTLDYSVGFFMLPIVISAAHSVLHFLTGVLGEKPVGQELATE